MSGNLRLSVALLLAAVAPSQAQSREPLIVDAKLGTQLTVAQIQRVVVGNTLSWGAPGATRFQFVGRDGMLRGGDDKGKRYTLKWHFRRYDNLFCLDSGDPASSGCVQLLRQGDQISYRRKDGVVELTATVVRGNARGL
ncbi:MAG: hypothetical protein ABR588_08840 [Sphingomicrobium sp.]|nr:hypothetical protein [Sphingomonadales bacterium]